MATIRVRNNNLFIDYTIRGKRVRKSLGLRKNRENLKYAETLRKKIEADIEDGFENKRLKRIKGKNKRLQEGFDQFIKERAYLKGTTIEHYKLSFKKIIDYCGNIRINQVDRETIEDLEKKLKLQINKNSIASYFNKLSVIFKYFVEEGWAVENPITRKKLEPKEIVIIPDKELEQILLVLQSRNRTHYKFIAMLLLTGLRTSELINLSFDDIDFKRNIMKVNNEKAGRIDLLPLHTDLREFLLNEWTNYTGRLFNYKGRDSLKFFRRFLRREGFNHYSLHTLRKTYISKLINSGLSVFDVMTLARHKKIQTTLQHYTAADIQRMGNEISEHAHLGNLLGKKYKEHLKVV